MSVSPPSALLVAVGEAEPLVGRHRLRFDPVAERGVPAHVTALFPFVPRDDLAESVLRRVAAAVGGHAAFDYRFSSTAWFDRDVLYLAPDDPAPFATLTRALEREFPDYPPYGGLYDDLAPHLTVAHQADEADLRAVEADLRSGLPIAGRAEHLTLMTEDDDGLWSVRHRFPFAG
jgi:2'-5' RNA ligase superfamily